MKSWIQISLLAIASTFFGLETTDQKTIETMIDHFTDAWNHQAGKGSAKYYAEDADFVNIFGMLFSGKEEIEARHVKIHEAFLKDSLFEVVNLKIREAKPGVAIAQVFWKVSNIGAQKEAMEGIFTHTIVQNGDTWEFAATQNTKILR